MNTLQELKDQMAGMTDAELQKMFARQEDWTPQALDAARVELQRRSIAIPEPPKPPLPEAESCGQPSTAPLLCGVSRVLSLLAVVILVGLNTIGWGSSFVQDSLRGGGGLGQIWTPSALLGLIAISTGHLGLGRTKKRGKGRLTTIIGLVFSYIIVSLWILLLFAGNTTWLSFVAAFILAAVVLVSRRRGKNSM